MRPIIHYCMILALLTSCLVVLSAPVCAQSVYADKETKPPYRILTAGNQISIRSTKDIKTVMVWTTSGSRILEKSVLAPLYSFRVPTQHKLIFLRIELTDGKTYSEKIGVN
ncbi:MAG: hypothetical protein ABWZ25_14600 [Chitinophagaceae bacterium]